MSDMKKFLESNLSLVLFLTFYLISTISFGQTNGKITSNGYWIHPEAEEIVGLKTGPFVRLDDGGLLTIEKNMSCISMDDGKTWEYYSIFQDSSKFDIRIERVLFKTSSGAIILAFANRYVIVFKKVGWF